MKKYIHHIVICLLFLSLFCTTAKAQKDCGTKPTEAEKNTYSNLIKSVRLQQQRTHLASFYYIRVFIHNFISDDATDSAWTYAEIINEFNLASSLFTPYNMCLVLAGIDYPRNTAFKDIFYTSNFNSLLPLEHTYAIDITLHNTLQDGTTGLNGTAYSIGGKWLSLSRGAIGNRSFAHEMGHALGMFHTFETGFCIECPDGSNGTNCGDKIPDTRATPDADSAINANTNASCLYTGAQTLFCNGANRSYNPEITNIMSYGRRVCRSQFSTTQVNYMKAALEGFAVLQGVWFPPPSFTLIAPAFGTIVMDTDAYENGSSIQIGNNHATVNVLIGGNNSIQKIISPTQIRITPGVRLLQPNNERGRIQIKAAGYCQE